MVLPGHVPGVVESRQMRRGGDVGEAQMVAGEPGAAFGQIGDVFEMQVQRLHAVADRLAVGRAEAEKALHHFLFDQSAGHLAVELVVEPRDQPPHLGLGEGISQDQRPLRIDLVEIFADGPGMNDLRAGVLDQDRHVAGRVHLQELGPPLPGLLNLHFERQVLLGQRDPDLPRTGREPEMVEGAHRSPLYTESGAGIAKRAEGGRVRARDPARSPA